MKKKENNYALALILTIILAFVLRYYKANTADLWADEGFSYWLSSQSIPIILDYLYNFDAHPPLFYFFLHWWIKFGSNPLTLRIPGIILGSLSLIGVYFLGKELINKKVGLIAAFLTTVSVFHISMCREIRMYVYLSFFVIFGFYFFVKLFNSYQLSVISYQKPEYGEQRATSDKQQSASDEQRATSNGIYWFLYTICMVISWYIHYLGICITITHNIIVLLFNRRINIKYWTYSQLAILICYIPWYKYLFYQFLDIRGPYTQFFPWQNIVILPILSFTSLTVKLPMHNSLFWIVFIGVLFILGTSFVNNYKNKYFLVVTFMGFFGLFLLFLLKYVLTRNGAFIIRYFSYILPLYFIIIASSFIKEDKVKVFFATIILICFLSLNLMGLYNLYYIKGFSPQRWSEAANYLEKYYKKNDCIIIQSGLQKYPFNYYFKQNHKEYSLSENDIVGLPDIIKKHERVWLVMSFVEENDPQRKVLKWLVNNCDCKQFVIFENFAESSFNISVVLLKRRH